MKKEDNLAEPCHPKAERALAGELIDLIEDQIRKAHPSINKKARKWKGNVLLYGEKYYETEDMITDILVTFEKIKKRQTKSFNPSKRSKDEQT